jgi:hypothetical protein
LIGKPCDLAESVSSVADTSAVSSHPWLEEIPKANEIDYLDVGNRPLPSDEYRAAA